MELRPSLFLEPDLESHGWVGDSSLMVCTCELTPHVHVQQWVFVSVCVSMSMCLSVCLWQKILKNAYKVHRE